MKRIIIGVSAGVVVVAIVCATIFGIFTHKKSNNKEDTEVAGSVELDYENIENELAGVSEHDKIRAIPKSLVNPNAVILPEDIEVVEEKKEYDWGSSWNFVSRLSHRANRYSYVISPSELVPKDGTEVDQEQGEEVVEEQINIPSEFEDFNDTRLTGQEVFEAVNKFVGRNVATVVYLKSINNISDLRHLGVSGFALNYNALLTSDGEPGNDGNMPDRYTASFDGDTVIVTPEMNGLEKFFSEEANSLCLIAYNDNEDAGKALYVPEGKTYYHGELHTTGRAIDKETNIKGTADATNRQYISSTSKFISRLIVNNENQVIGIFFKEL